MKAVAEAIGSTIPMVYGGGAIGTTAARRWKMAVNHNVKSPAFWAAMPELCHNELVGWDQQGTAVNGMFSQVQLRHDWEHPQTMRRFEYVEQRTRSIMSDILTVQAEGDGPIAQLFDLILFGDLVSLELAAARGIDPGPLAVVDDLKRWLE
ncbi:MAG: SIS domain-containing protein [Acidimicrobiales bacterium]